MSSACRNLDDVSLPLSQPFWKSLLLPVSPMGNFYNSFIWCHFIQNIASDAICLYAELLTGVTISKHNVFPFFRHVRLQCERNIVVFLVKRMAEVHADTVFLLISAYPCIHPFAHVFRHVTERCNPQIILM